MANSVSLDYAQFSSIDTQIESYIEKLSQKILSPEEVEANAVELSAIYESGYECDYRHSYSKFFALISRIASVSKGSTENNEATECLSTNLVAVREHIVDKHVSHLKGKPKNYYPGNQPKVTKTGSKTQQNVDKPKTEYVKKSVLKLTDHILIEIARYRSVADHVNQQLEIAEINRRVDSLRSELGLVGESIAETQKEFTKSTKQLDKATKKARSLQNDLISVLGIFSAIALASVAGITFTTSTIESLHLVRNPYRLYLTLCLVGFVLCNLIFGLMYCIGKLTGKTVLSPCECHTDENGSCDPKRKCNVFKKVKRRLPFCYFINMTFLIVAAVILLSWAFDVVSVVDSFNNFGNSKEMTSSTDIVSNAEVTVGSEMVSNIDVKHEHS